jgi:hypothetical protein
MGVDWYSKNLGDAMLAGEALARIEALFKVAYAKAGYPEDMSLYIRHESEGRLHCEVIIYLSLPAADVAQEIDAESCEKPSSYGLGLLLGG